METQKISPFAVTGTKWYDEQNIGKCKYIVNHHDGVKAHKDGSAFYDIAIFKNKKKKEIFVNTLRASGYKDRGWWTAQLKHIFNNQYNHDNENL